jgi:hypothetical protein
MPGPRGSGKEISVNGSGAALTERFLRALWPDPPAGYLLLWVKGMGGRDKHSYWFPSSDLGRLAEAAAAHARSRDVYLGCALSPADYGVNQRCKAGEAVAIPGVWADIDVLDGAHKKTALPPTVADAVTLANEMPLSPSLLVYSGHGIQPWWLFKEPWVFAGDNDRQAGAALVSRWQEHLRVLARRHKWELDNVSDLARVLRLPGTVNRKSEPVPVTVEV